VTTEVCRGQGYAGAYWAGEFLCDDAPVMHANGIDGVGGESVVSGGGGVGGVKELRRRRVGAEGGWGWEGVV
jgi:hypothetical protein